ncbi:MAG: hypothetical protein NVS4B8_16060 [Herpetosiphon sp.]
MQRPDLRRIRRPHAAAHVATALILFLSAVLVSCGQTTLLSDVHASDNGRPPVIHPNGSGDTITISYRIGQPALVSVVLRDKGGKTYTLRNDVPRVPSGDPYTLRFDGTVVGSDNTDPSIKQRVLPDGTYNYVVRARSQSTGAVAEQGGTLVVSDAATRLPLIQDLRVQPEVISPNEDAIDDVTTFSYRLPITATVSIAFQAPEGPVPFITDLVEGPYEQSHIWDGKRPDGSLLASGTYTYTVTARDTIGNIVARQGTIRVEAPGRSEAQITYFSVGPTNVELGGVITATIRVKNTGTVPIRTQGPAAGFRYSTNDIFSSIDNHRWAAKGGGFWRVALDWNSGHGYPFRWAMSSRPADRWAVPNQSDVLNPGDEATIVGTVQILEREDKLIFFAGLAHEGVGYPVNRKGGTLIHVSF